MAIPQNDSVGDLYTIVIVSICRIFQLISYPPTLEL